MKTVVIWDSCGVEPIRFFVVNRDLEHLNGKFYGSVDCSEEDGQEVSNLVYTDSGEQYVEMMDSFPVDAVKAGAKVIVCGYMP